MIETLERRFRFFTSRPAARNLALCGYALAGLAACSHQTPEYAWSHSASGEYLFAFDLRECGEQAQDLLVQAGAPAEAARRSPQFFGCMNERGYFLVDPATGLALIDGQSPRIPAQNPPQALR